jgi:hypothetical protein
MITEEMRIKVMDKLHEIEQGEHVKILYAVETASRAWGFASENSDWDVRFIYVHSLPWYVSIAQQRDVIEYMSDDRMLDMVGWDLKKALALMRHDASSINEWLHTPLTYCCDEVFLNRMLQLEKACFSPKQGVNHYFGFARHMATEKVTSQLTTMKYILYFVRVLLACRWIEAKLSPPPVPFIELIQTMVADDSIKTKLLHLINKKKASMELDTALIDSLLMDYAKGLYQYYTENIRHLDLPADKPNVEKEMDELLLDMVRTINTESL